MAKTFQDIVDSGAEVVRKGSSFTNWETIYKCPFCEEVRGTPDKRGHLYYNEQKRRGKCFRCETTVVYGRRLSLEEVCQDFQRFNDESNSPETTAFSSWNVESWSVPAYSDPLGAQYLSKRGVSPQVAEAYNLRFAKDPYACIVLPNGYGSSVNFFQIRKLEVKSDYELRYINPSGTKPVYGTFLPPREVAVITEGPFSAISAYNPDVMGLGLYGKSMSAIQHDELKSLSCVKHYILCLDGGEGYAVLRGLDHLLDTGRQVSVLMLPYGKDPNDLIVGFSDRLATAIPVNRTRLQLVSSKVKLTAQNKVRFQERAWINLWKLLINPALPLEVS